jgi:magnesium transporter
MPPKGAAVQRNYCIDKDRVCEAGAGDAPIMVFVNPDRDELKLLAETWLLDEHTLASALDPDEVSRLEFEPEHHAIILKRPQNYSSLDDLLFKVTSLGLFVFADKLILVMAEDIPVFEHDPKHPLKIRGLKDAVLKVLFGTIRHFLGHLRIINQISDAIEQKINTSMENKYLLNFFTLQKGLVYYLNGIGYNAALFEKLKNAAAKAGLTSEQLETLEDIIIENGQCLKQAEIYSNILAGLMDARASIVNNNLSLLIKRLTIINVVFLPLNFFAGMGGMSEFSMMTTGIPWWLAYPAFAIIMSGVAIVMFKVLSKIGYKGRERRKLFDPTRGKPGAVAKK